MIKDYIKRIPFYYLWSFIYLTACFLIPSFSYEGDTVEWKRWATYIYENGLQNAYQSDINYPPVFLYILWLYQWIFNSPDLIAENLIWIKYVILLFDLLPLFIIWRFFPKHFNYSLIFWLCFNIGYLHNTTLWGQIDALPAFFAGISILFISSNPIITGVFYSISLFSKFQVIIFLPVLALAFLNTHGFNLKKIIQLKLSFIITSIIVFLPFILNNQLNNFTKMLSNQVGLYPACSMNAYNLWYLILNENPLLVMDNELFLGTSYKHWGMAMFFLFSAIVLIPVLIKIIKKQKIENELFFLVASIISLLFFFFNTEMHERYSYFSLLPLFFYGVFRKNFIPFIFISLLYFLNTDLVLNFIIPAKLNYPFFHKAIALFFLSFIIYLTILLYKHLTLKNSLK